MVCVSSYLLAGVTTKERPAWFRLASLDFLKNPCSVSVNGNESDSDAFFDASRHGSACLAEGRRNLAYNRRVAREKGARGRESERESERKAEVKERTRAGESVVRVPRRCVMAQRGGNTDVGIPCPLGPVPIPSTAITYNNDGPVEPVGDLTSAERREREDTAG